MAVSLRTVDVFDETSIIACLSYDQAIEQRRIAVRRGGIAEEEIPFIIARSLA